MQGTFWTESRRESFRAILGEVKQAFGLSNPDIIAAVFDNVVSSPRSVRIIDADGTVVNEPVPKQHDVDKDVDPWQQPDVRTISRFLAGRHKTENDTLSALLIGVGENILLRKDLTTSDCIKCGGLVALYRVFQQAKFGEVDDRVEFFLTSIKPDRRVEGDQENPDEDVVASDLRKPFPLKPRTDVDRRRDAESFLSYFKRPATASADLEKKLFFERDSDKIFFITYRFSANRGIVQRSFTVVHRPSQEVPVVRFANFIDAGGAPRRSDGIAISFEQEVVFLGHSDHGASIKVMSFANASRPLKGYYGILMTNDPEDGSLASRFVMIRTEISKHQDVDTGPIEIGDLKKVLEPKWVDRLRNKVDFSMEDPVFDHNGEKVSQEGMVSIVEKRLYDGDKVLLADSEGTLFNPARTMHYTFNSALKRGG
ncbi:hypothetical protein [Puniceibacterium antarcticum]|uniref:hypothetical protein n=1 Tax=Puniceibacterium antarcticum TaxID=1206336 RepID=UPI00117AE57E|nr:hypothetical protein [Puniceibacterium antarcticum]